MDLFEAASHVAQVIAATAVIYAAVTYSLNRKQLNFDVITSCTARWQEIMPNLEKTLKDGEHNWEVEERYVDLCNEELFYFVEGYLPKAVVGEWLTGMVLYVPHYRGEIEDEDLKEVFDRMVRPERLEGYPRVRSIFNLDRPYNPKEEREELVGEIEKKIEDFYRTSWLPRIFRLGRRLFR